MQDIPAYYFNLYDFFFILYLIAGMMLLGRMFSIPSWEITVLGRWLLALAFLPITIIVLLAMLTVSLFLKGAAKLAIADIKSYFLER